MKGKKREYIVEKSYFVCLSSRTANKEEWKLKHYNSFQQ